MVIRGLYTIADSRWNPYPSLFDLAERYLAGGARIIQLRMKEEGGADKAAEVGRAIMSLKERYHFTFIMNDYVDAAVELGADGVHVGSNDMALDEVKRRVRSGMIVGYSAHDIGEACAAARAGADYVAFGAVFPTRTKGPGHPVQGIERLKRVVEAVDAPVVAIGGIDRANVDEVMRAGASAVAMITGLCRAKSAETETRWFADRLSFTFSS